MLCDVERKRLGKGAVGHRKAPQVPDNQIDRGTRLPGEVRADVDANLVRPEILIPDERAPAATPEIDDPIGANRREKRSKHVVANRRRQQGRGHGLVPRIRVQRRVLVLCRFSERGGGRQIEEVAVPPRIEAPAALTCEIRETGSRTV